MAKLKETMKEIMPTGIDSLDPLIGGGFRRGSLTLLLGELGSGHDEFLITSAGMLAAKAPSARENVLLPKEICWALFMKQPSDLVEEITWNFHSDLSGPFQKSVNLHDFFSLCVRGSPYLPTRILEEITATEKRKPKSMETLEEIGKAGLAPSTILLESLADFLVENVPNNMVVLYTLTDLVGAYRKSEEEWRSFILFLHWLQRSIRKWGGVVYTNLMNGFLDKKMENELSLCFDNVLVFEREILPHEVRKVMTIQKVGISAPPQATKFEIKITPYGFSLERVKLVERLRG